MRQQQFMMDYFKEGDTVTVNAVELQHTLRDLVMARAEVKSLRRSVEFLRGKVTVMELEKPIEVKLDIKV